MERNSETNEPLKQSETIADVAAESWSPDPEVTTNQVRNDYAAAEPDELEVPNVYSQASTAREEQSTENEPADEWTVVIDLAAAKNLYDPKDGNKPVALGSTEKAEELRRLAAQTDGKPVDIFVQLVAEQEDGSTVLERYEIEDGRVTELEDKAGDNFASDLEDWLRVATANSDSENLALIINADGAGTMGMTGDDSAPGEVHSSSEIVEAIKNGLAGSEHTEVDVLDLDVCLMAEAGFLNYAGEVTDNLVASAETERIRPGGVNGQDVAAIVSNLLENPEMSAEQFAESIVDLAAAGVNQAPPMGEARTRYDTGTNSLVYLDLERHDRFDAAYNDFGNRLASAVQDADNKAEIDRLISATPRYGVEGSALVTDSVHNRDLRTFVENVQASIENGMLNDPDGSLMNSATELLTAQDEMTVANFGEDTAEGYDEMGGLSAFLPDATYRNSREAAGNLTQISQLSRSLERIIGLLDGLVDLEPDKMALSIESNAQSVLQYEDRDSEGVLAPLRDVVDDLDSVKSEEELRVAFNNVKRIVDDLRDSNLNEELTEEILPSVQASHDALFDVQAAAGDSGWTNFINAMGR